MKWWQAHRNKIEIAILTSAVIWGIFLSSLVPLYPIGKAIVIFSCIYFSSKLTCIVYDKIEEQQRELKDKIAVAKKKEEEKYNKAMYLSVLRCCSVMRSHLIRNSPDTIAILQFFHLYREHLEELEDQVKNNIA